MAKTRFRNLFRGAKLSSRRPEPEQATQSSPPAKAEQRQLFAEPASVAEAEVPARASEPVPTVPDAPPSGVGSSFAQSFRTTRQHTRSAPQGCAS